MGGEPEKPHKAAEEFLDEFASRFQAIQERHGDEVAGRVISLAEISSCIFSWEMRLAAESLVGVGASRISSPYPRRKSWKISRIENRRKCPSSSCEGGR